ncbi:tape measure protein [Nocardia arthritidis]|uniref:Tape measure protein N-terminal domain-containing protein n=1 Tax=Nocardia arthritidis TaxID=228602 RepID=A0A6G9YTS1_9NOCA|nr:tape measure protein [Nocardia arthritidis]QIS16501.1 hypothetical protein F5544_43485 [Nocardia arthritidis]
MGTEMARGVGDTLRTGFTSAVSAIPFANILTSALNTGLKGAAVATAAAAGGTIATALTKGFERLTAIDTARGKLTGLGHDAEAVSGIMESALAAVKGTAFGLGDAATIAASAVAAGVKPGEQLTAYLKLTADAASIAGSSLGEMGSIINKVQTGQKAYTGDLNMLADRGLPIFQWLQAEYKVSAAQLSKMVEAGKVDSETFKRVIQKNIGGAALASGNTFRGSISNLNAALGRLGAAAEQPTFNRMIGWVNGATAAVDRFTPKTGQLAKQLDAKIFTEFGPRLAKTFNELKSSKVFQDNLSQVKSVFESLVTTGRAAATAIKSIVSTLTGASSATGISTWQILLKTLEATATIANSVLVPALQTIAGLMQNHTGLVTALVAGWLAFRTIPNMLTSFGASLSGTTSQAGAMARNMREVATATGRTAEVAGYGATTLGRFGSAIQQMGTHSPVIARMQSAFLDSAAGATRFGRTAGTASAALVGLRSAAGGVVSALGGPWALAITAATVGVVKFGSDLAEHEQRVKAVGDAWRGLVKSRNDIGVVFNENRGGFDDKAMSNVTAQVGQLNDAMEKAAANRTKWYDVRALFQAPWNDNVRKENWDADQYKAAQSAIENLGMSNERIAQMITGDSSWDQLRTKLESAGQGGKFAAQNLQWLQDTIMQSRQVAANTTPGFFSLSEAFKTIADNASSADQRLTAMKRALDVLSGRPMELGNAMQAYNQVIRQTTESSQGLAEASQGLGQELINTDGSINTKTANGDKLRTSLLQIRDATLDVAKAGGDLGPIYANNAAAFEKLGKQFGLDKDQVTALAASIGYLPDKITMLAELRGANDTTQQLAVIKSLLDKNREGVDIPTDLPAYADVKKKLEELGLKVTNVVGKPGIVKITADTKEAWDKLHEIDLTKISNKTFTVTELYNRVDNGLNNREVRNNAKPYSPESGYVHYETGGSVTGAGTGTSDSIPAMLSHGEHVWTAREVDAVGGQNAMRGLRAAALAGGLKFATGGEVPFGIEEAIKAAQEMEGHAYKWAGIGPSNFDCSGFIGFLQQVAMGLGKATKRLYTTNTLLEGQTAGLKPGTGPSDTWFRVGVSTEHMAATIAGLNVESGGAYGTSGIGGGRAGAADSQFPNKFYLPNELVAGFGSLTTGGKLITWTDDDELELLQLQEAVTQAQQRRDKVYGEEKATDSDKRKADLDVRAAQNKVLKKQEQKDRQGQLEGGTRIAPQAPALQKKYSDDEKSKAELLQAVEQANKNRNQVYDDKTSTEADKQIADIKLQDAIEKLEKGGDSNTKSPANTLKDVFTTFASSAAGILFDAFKAQLPDKISGSRWWDVADKVIALSNYNKDKNSPANGVGDALSNIGTFGAEAFLGQLGYTKKPNQIPDWVKNLKSAAVYDTGGWLPPGGMAVNLSSTPEPIFNSPQQLHAFAGSQLQPAQSGNLTEQDLERYMRLRPVYNITTADVRGAVQEIRTEQKRQSMTYMRR